MAGQLSEEATASMSNTCTSSLLYCWPVAPMIRSLVMNSDCARVQRLVEKHRIDLKRIFSEAAPVTMFKRKLPQDCDVLPYLAECGLQVEHFGPDIFHAMCSNSALSTAGKWHFDVMHTLASLGFDLDYRVRGDTVLEAIAKSLARGNKKLDNTSLYIRQKLFTMFVNFKCQPIFIDRSEDALRILAQALSVETGLISGREVFLEGLPRRLQSQFYEVAGALNLIKHEGELPSASEPYHLPSFREVYILRNVTYATLTETLNLWTKAVGIAADADDNDDDIVDACGQTSTNAFTSTENSSDSGGRLIDPYDRIEKVEFLQGALDCIDSTKHADPDLHGAESFECRFRLLPFLADIQSAHTKITFDMSTRIKMNSAFSARSAAKEPVETDAVTGMPNGTTTFTKPSL